MNVSIVSFGQKEGYMMAGGYHVKVERRITGVERLLTSENVHVE
jgi:hypothetical protein